MLFITNVLRKPVRHPLIWCLFITLGLSMQAWSNEFAVDPSVLSDLESRGERIDKADDEDIEFIRECPRKFEPLIEKLTQMQPFDPVNPDIIYPQNLRDQIVTIFKKCISLIDDELLQTKAEITQSKSETKCTENIEEISSKAALLKSEVVEMANADLSTKDGRAKAFGKTSALQLTLLVIQGRAALNRHLVCKLSRIKP